MVRNLTYVWLPVPLNIFFYCFSLHLFTFWGNFSATSCCTPNKWHSKQVPLLLPFSRENWENFFFGCYMLRPLFSLSRRFRYLSLCETSSLFLSKHVKKKEFFLLLLFELGRITRWFCSISVFITLSYVFVWWDLWGGVLSFDPMNWYGFSFWFNRAS